MSFFKALNQTIWSGLHADLFEKNRYKRMNGQKFYARYIQNADPELYALPTAKGYAPADVLAFSRWPVLLCRLFLRPYNRKPEWDNHSVEAYFQKYFGKLSKQIEKEVLPGFLRRHLQTSFNQIPKAKNLEHWIKWYSIALGWSSAHFPKNAIIPGPGKSLPFNN